MSAWQKQCFTVRHAWFLGESTILGPVFLQTETILLLCAAWTTWKARPRRPLLQLYRKSGAFEVETPSLSTSTEILHHEAIYSHGSRNAPFFGSYIDFLPAFQIPLGLTRENLIVFHGKH